MDAAIGGEDAPDDLETRSALVKDVVLAANEVAREQFLQVIKIVK
jgi:hypothetical protein